MPDIRTPSTDRTRLIGDDLADECSVVTRTDDDLASLAVQERAQRLALWVELSR